MNSSLMTRLVTKLKAYSFLWTDDLRLNTLSFSVFSFFYSVPNQSSFFVFFGLGLGGLRATRFSSYS